MCLQSLSLGLGEQWEKVKAAYAQANRALGDIVKVLPSAVYALYTICNHQERV